MLRGDNDIRPAPAFSPTSGRCRGRLPAVRVTTRIPPSPMSRRAGREVYRRGGRVGGGDPGRFPDRRRDARSHVGRGAEPEPRAGRHGGQPPPGRKGPDGGRAREPFAALGGPARALYLLVLRPLLRPPLRRRRGARRERPLFARPRPGTRSVHRLRLPRSARSWPRFGPRRLRQREPRGARGGARDLPQAQPRRDHGRRPGVRPGRIAPGRRSRGLAGRAHDLLGPRLSGGGKGGGGGRGEILAPAAWREPWGPQYGLSCAARALDSGVYVASANQIGDYPEARFATPGGVYGPDGLRVSRSPPSTGNLDPGAPGRWRRLYGDTLLDEFRAGAMGEEPLEFCS